MTLICNQSLEFASFFPLRMHTKGDKSKIRRIRSYFAYTVVSPNLSRRMRGVGRLNLYKPALSAPYLRDVTIKVCNRRKWWVIRECSLG